MNINVIQTGSSFAPPRVVEIHLEVLKYKPKATHPITSLAEILRLIKQAVIVLIPGLTCIFMTRGTYFCILNINPRHSHILMHRCGVGFHGNCECLCDVPDIVSLCVHVCAGMDTPILVTSTEFKMN